MLNFDQSYFVPQITRAKLSVAAYLAIWAYVRRGFVFGGVYSRTFQLGFEIGRIILKSMKNLEMNLKTVILAFGLWGRLLGGGYSERHLHSEF